MIIGNKVDETIPFGQNPEEVQATKWVSKEDLQETLRHTPESLTPWFRMLSQKLLFSKDSKDLWDVFTEESVTKSPLSEEIIDLNKL